MTEMTMADVAKLVRRHTFKGIDGFLDIEDILSNPTALKLVLDDLIAYYKDQEIDIVAGFDSRGNYFASVLAYAIGAGVRQIRKPGKLPGPVISETYNSEYDEDVTIQMEQRSLKGKKVLLVDDLLATGGTASAGVKLVERLGGEVVGFYAMIELPELQGRIRGNLWMIPVMSQFNLIDQELHADVDHCVDLFVRDSHTGDLVLIRETQGFRKYKMPGGHIDAHESMVNAAMREFKEETGCFVKGIACESVLTGLNRDPRGLKVSWVLSAMCSTTVDARGEPNTEIVTIPNSKKLPSQWEFSYDHGDFLHNFWPQYEEEIEKVRAKEKA